MIAIYLSTKNMTPAMYEEVERRLAAADVDDSAMKSHAVFGDEDNLMVFDIWESPEAWATFHGHLEPILQEVGIELNHEPDVMALVALRP